MLADPWPLRISRHRLNAGLAALRDFPHRAAEMGDGWVSGRRDSKGATAPPPAARRRRADDVRRAGDLIGMIGGEPEEIRVRLAGGDDLVVAFRPFHEDHPPARCEAGRDPVERLRDRRHRPGDHPRDLTGIIRADLVVVDLDLVEPEPLADLVEEVRPCPPSARPGSSGRPAGRSSAGCPASPAPSPYPSAATATRRTGAPAGYPHSASAPCSRSCGSASG